MLDILIIAPFTHLPSKEATGRFHYLATNLKKEVNNVEVLTSNFSHLKKETITYKKDDDENPNNYKFKLIKEPGYKKNISISRLYSHFIFSLNLKKYLKKRKKPDIIYCALPPLSVARVAGKFAKKNNIKFIIDIQDLWPESFYMIFDIPILNKVIFKPLEIISDKVYNFADQIISVSETYLERALMSNNHAKENIVAYLGTDRRKFDIAKYSYCAESNLIISNDMINIVYLGSLSHSYDLPLMFKAISKLPKEILNKIKIIIIGDGPSKDKFKKISDTYNFTTLYTGRLEYDKVANILYNSQIALNPIKDKSAASVINKVGDYAAAGLPVINTQNSKEYIELLEIYNAGISCDPNNIGEIIDALKLLILNDKLREELGNNNRKLFEERFDRNITYKKIIESICSEDLK